MITEEWRPIVERLVERTRAGDLDWQPHASNSFRVSLPTSQTLTVAEYSDDYQGDVTGHGVGLLNEAGAWIDGCDERTTDEEQPIKELFDAARRVALHVEEELRRLRASLG